MEKIIMNKTKHSVKIAHFGDPAEKQLINPVELDKKQNHVMIFDDVKLDDQTAIKKYFCSGRVNVFYLVQSLWNGCKNLGVNQTTELKSDMLRVEPSIEWV